MSGKDIKSLYFVALVPPEPVFGKAEKIKSDLSANFNTKASLRSPPHITLHMPFKYEDKKEENIVAALEKIHLETFQIVQNGFGAFPPRVIYIQVESSDHLTNLHKVVLKCIRSELKIIKDTYRDMGYKPHMTVAFRDLRPAMFKEAWKAIENVQISFTWEARSFFLLKHNGKQWGLLKEFTLNKKE